MENNLSKLHHALKDGWHQHPRRMNYALPDNWLSFDYQGDVIKTHDGHLLVNPYHFYASLIHDVYLSKAKPLQHYYQDKNLNEAQKDGNWIHQSIIYSSMIRTSSAYDHDRTGKLEDINIDGLKETGTFVKFLAYLPVLKRMGVDVLYLLPIMKYSMKDKKGELGSPYGVSNFFELDPHLKEPMTQDETSLEEEFKALVEAAHVLDMKVVIDFIPRTNSVNSDLILKHPDWFYWIDLEDLADYRPPMVEGLRSTLPARPEYFEALFSAPSVEEHLHKFRENPKQLNPELWEKALQEYHDADGVLEALDIVQKHFGMTVAPAFSDHINDPQPAWNDVTFFRMYMDHPVNSQPFLKELGEFNPYILFDVAKSSLNPGSIPNTELWELLSDVIPYYQNNFGIDGARIDMGHALPGELVDLILKKAKAINPDFSFIAEELAVDNAQSALDKGYNMIIGDGFIKEPRVQEGMFNSFVYSALSLPCPLFACGETHDTPRLANRPGKEALAKMLTLFNYFVPNAVTFINSGQEFFEKQPMNLGLDSKADEIKALAEDDPFHGKLALFDRYMLHYLHPKRFEMIDLMEQAAAIRSRLVSILSDDEKIYPLGFSAPWDMAAGFAYELENSLILVIANTDISNAKEHWVQLENLPDRYIQPERTFTPLFSSEYILEPVQAGINQMVEIPFKAGEVKVFEVK